jgi:hypothetical protein
MIRTLLLSLSLLFLASSSIGQCDDGRYRDMIFPGFTVTSDVLYGNNINYQGLAQDLFLDIYRPEGDTEISRPLIVVCHGGSYVSGSKTGLDVVPFCRDMAKMGYVVASIQYRLGVPLTFDLEGPFKEAVLRGTHDSRAAVRFFRKNVAENGNQYGIDPDKIFFAGSSAGAINALHLGYMDTEAEIAQYVDQSAPGLGGGVEGVSGNAGYSSEVSGIINIAGAIASPDLMQEGDAPVCSFHGTGDTVVPFGTDMLTISGIIDIDTVHGSSIIDARAEALGIEHCFTVQWLQGHVPHLTSALYYDSLRSISSNFLSHLVCPQFELDCEYRIIDIATSLPEFQVTESKIWPNPASTELHILSGTKRGGNFMMLDVTGQKVRSGILGATEKVVSLEGLPNGLYLLQLEDERGMRTMRFHKSGY